MSTSVSLRRSSRRTKSRVLAATTTPPSSSQTTPTTLRRASPSGSTAKASMAAAVPMSCSPTRGRWPQRKQPTASPVRPSAPSEQALSTPRSGQTNATLAYSKRTVRSPCSPTSTVSEDSDQCLSKPASPSSIEPTPKRSVHALLGPDGITSAKRRCRRKPLFPTPSLPHHAVTDSGPLCPYQPSIALAHTQLQTALTTRSTHCTSSRTDLLSACRRTRPHGPLAHCHMQAVFELYGCAPDALYHTVCPLGPIPGTHPKRPASSQR